MRVAILALYDFDEVKGGTELFVRHIQGVFPDNQVLKYSSCARSMVLPDLSKVDLQYARMGMAISKRFADLHRRDPFDLVICSDLAGLGLKVLCPEVPAIQVFHYTYKGFASSAMRGQPGYYASRHLQPLFENVTANGKKVVAVSHKTRRELESHYGRSALVIENGVSMDQFRPLDQGACRERLGIRWDGPLGIFVGRPDRTKGFDVVQELSRIRRDVRFLCVTGSALRGEGMFTARNVPNHEMPIYYSAADFLLFPSRYESASYTTIEAMACGLPVVAHRTGLFEDIEAEKVGVILDQVDAPTFSQGIDHLLGNKGTNPRLFAMERFSMERFAEEYQALARDMVGQGPA